ncbi:MAG: SDR family NAD(P)-dependent oxidoreductase [Candidatus Aureabacteria bacterium]|nr:SDR family NAD(P)-dependent oxidoreductase [Candidatus Auribacterota bacterium]
MKLRGKIAIVTGGGRGIGKNIALAYGREGASVVVAARSRDEIEAIRREISDTGVSSLAVECDVARYADVERLVHRTRERFGAVDILVNAAGVQGPIGPLAEADPEAWRHAVTVNLIGVFHGCRAVIPGMIARGGGRIVNLSGGGAVSPRPFFTAYSASKAAIARLTESLAEEILPHRIMVNTMAPGATPTRMMEEIARGAQEAAPKEAQQAGDILRRGGVDTSRQAALAVFLASDDSEGLTGRMLHTNDDWPSHIGRIGDLMASDLYRIKRVQPGV